MEERKLSAELMETKKEGRKKRDRNVTIQITRENCYVFYVQDCEVKDAF